MTTEWPGITPEEKARILTLRVATAQHFEGIARVQLKECLTYYETVQDGPVPTQELESLIRTLANEWELHRASLRTARQQLQHEKDLRLQQKRSLQGLDEEAIRSARMRMTEDIDIAAPTPLDELLAKHQSPQPSDETDEDEDQPLRRLRR